MAVASRLKSDGTLLVNGIFDENTSISPSKFRTTSNTVYAGTFDEVTLQGGSLLFNGPTGYRALSISSIPTITGTGTFTIEAWVYPLNYTDQVLISRPPTAGDNTQIFRLNDGGTQTSPYGISIYDNGTQLFKNIGTGTFPVINQWTHLAWVKNGTTNTLYINGVSSATYTGNVPDITPNQIGYLQNYAYPFNGNLTNIRIVNGVAVYTSNFTPPTQPLAATQSANTNGNPSAAITGAQTMLLLDATSSATFITDSSTNGYTVTNSGAGATPSLVAYSSSTPFPQQRLTNTGTLQIPGIFDEITGAPIVDNTLMLWLDAGQTASYSGSGTTWTDLSPTPKNYTLTAGPTYSSTTGAGVLTFNAASSQYATSAVTLFNSTTFNTYTMSLWVYPTSSGNLVQVDGQTAPNSGYHYSAIEISAAGVIKFGQWTGALDSVIATSTQSLNAWYNLVITYNGTTATAYINGTSVGSSAIAWSGPGASTFMALMAIDSTNMGTGAYASGNVGAFMVYNRALSLDEVTTNFNALRGRYGV